MTEDMQDMRTPENWKVGADLRAGLEPLAEPPHFRGAVSLDAMRLVLVSPDDHLGTLVFTRPDGQYWQLATATSPTQELTAFLAQVTRTRSLTWWKRKALFEITTSEAAWNEDAARDAGDVLGAYLHRYVGEVSTAQLLSTPVRRQRKRVTDDRLEEIAEMWKRAAASGSRTPTKDVWEIVNEGKTGNAMLSRDRVRHLVSEARKAGKIDAAHNGPPRSSPSQLG